ncbi:DUF5107 domain-containing protein [Fulvivirgaceae bacterium BMA12]|uniref:DUF5107 domain-containing protein n=1 Tax=Agaribacillus aureus TaxID=3051825 RepID=A0ABT8LE26_9BACT|nr:DUF5107 domain-containing protein [Fulvivirgaceae bacterium BMA12]
MKALITLSLCLFQLATTLAQEGLKMYEKEITIPTYEVGEPRKVPYFYTGRAYQGAQGRVYPYAFDGNLSDEKKDVSYKGLFLENKFLEICVLPALGGRLYSMVDKTNGYNVIYKNNVIKPSLIGMLGAWISGGVEWNIPHHHRASTFMPTDYELVENKDGSKTIWVGELEIRHQIRWMVGLTMFPDNAILKVDIKYINQTELPHQFLVWANTAVHTNENYQVIYPPRTEFATFHRKIDFTKWPVSNEMYRGNKFDNTDISLWKNTPEGGSFFAWEDQGQFVAGIDHGKKAGICVVGNKNIVIGKKLWTWGTSPRADMWEKILTDEDGPYIEIMTGAYSNNQPDYSWCHPYFTKEATMYFMPLRGMQNVKESTLDAAVNFEMQGDRKALMEVYAYTDFEAATVQVKNDTKTIWSTKTTLGPAHPKNWVIDLPADMAYHDLLVLVEDNNNRELVSYKPEEKAGNPMPDPVKPPKAPHEIEDIEALVFAGLRLEQIFNPLVSPLPYYEEAVKRAPKNAFANLRLGAWYLKAGEFDKAEKHLQRAADRWTTDYTRARDCEAFYLLGLTKMALDKKDEAFDCFYRASWDYTWYGASHLQLSMIESSKGKYHAALDHIDKALSVGVKNSRAHEIKLSLLRKLDMTESVSQQLKDLLQIDPLNLYVYGEKLLADPANSEVFFAKMRGEIQNYLDLIVKLGNCGLYDDAIAILKFAEKDKNPGVNKNPLIYYYQGYYQQLAGNDQAGNLSYQAGAQMAIDYCFPFRQETEKVLKAAVKQNPSDFKAWYYLGNLLYDHQPDKAIKKWEKAIAINNEFAMAHRNLSFAANHFEKNPQKAGDHIALAIKYDPTQPEFYFEQDNYAIKTGEAPEVRLAHLNKAGNIIHKNDNPLSRKVNLELLQGSTEEALKILQNHHFRKVEGVGNIHNTWVDAWLIKGKKLLKSGNTAEALKCFEKTIEYPRNLDIGQNSREGQSHYFIGLALEKSGQKNKAKKHYKKSVEMDFKDNDLYYRGMAFLKLGDKKKAEEVFNGLIEKGNERIESMDENDFFSIFGNQRSDNVRLAEAYALQGLGYWGLNKKDKAEELFDKALTEDPSNFQAKTRLFN